MIKSKNWIRLLNVDHLKPILILIMLLQFVTIYYLTLGVQGGTYLKDIHRFRPS